MLSHGARSINQTGKESVPTTNSFPSISQTQQNQQNQELFKPLYRADENDQLIANLGNEPYVTRTGFISFVKPCDATLALNIIATTFASFPTQTTPLLTLQDWITRRWGNHTCIPPRGDVGKLRGVKVTFELDPVTNGQRPQHTIYDVSQHNVLAQRFTTTAGITSTVWHDMRNSELLPQIPA